MSIARVECNEIHWNIVTLFWCAIKMCILWRKMLWNSESSIKLSTFYWAIFWIKKHDWCQLIVCIRWYRWDVSALLYGRNELCFILYLNELCDPKSIKDIFSSLFPIDLWHNGPALHPETWLKKFRVFLDFPTKAEYPIPREVKNWENSMCREIP